MSTTYVRENPPKNAKVGIIVKGRALIARTPRLVIERRDLGALREVRSIRKNGKAIHIAFDPQCNREIHAQFTGEKIDVRITAERYGHSPRKYSPREAALRISRLLSRPPDRD